MKKTNLKKILFIAMHRKERSPSQRFRFEQYFTFLESKGFYCELSYLISEKDDRILYSSGNYLAKLFIFIKSWIKRTRDVNRANQFNYIFIQREAFMTSTTYFEKKFSKTNAKLIFDFDDSIWIEDKSSVNSKLAFLKNPEKISKIIALSTTIVAGNHYLANYAMSFNKNIKIIPSTIDTDYYKLAIPTHSSKVTIGWSGSFSTIKYFERAIESLMVIKKKYGEKVAFKIISSTKYNYKPLNIIGKKWQAKTEVEDLKDIDIGIMPLPDTDWAKGKCGLKGLQYMGVGIPTILSPVGVNIDIIEHGKNGFLASTNQEWIHYLSELIDSSELRVKLGKEGRKTVEEKYSVKANQMNYLNLFLD